MRLQKRLFQTSLALAAIVGIGLVPLAGAQVSQEIVIGQGSTSHVVRVPSTTVRPGEHLFIEVNNPTANAAVFSVPKLGIQHTVPPNDDRTFFINTTNLPPGDVPYTVTDAGGNQLASGVIDTPDIMDAQTATALSSIINYSTAYSAPVKPEPVYYTDRPAAFQPTQDVQERPVRGYW